MATKRKYHEVALKVKYEAFKEVEKGRSNKGVANQFSIPGSTFATWKKNKEIFEAFQNSSLKRQRLKSGTYEKSSEALLVTTFQSVVLFFWRKLINLLRPSATKVLQHRTDGCSNGSSSLACIILYIVKKHPLLMFFEIWPK